jgi:predicted O-linked N-acetylglucosamine transferase (SPINDLY family)
LEWPEGETTPSEVSSKAQVGGEPTSAERERAIALVDAGQNQELERLARELVSRYPASGIAWKSLWISLQAQGKDALLAIQKYAQLRPSEAAAHCALGATLVDRGRWEEAANSCRQSLAIDANSAEAYCNLGIALQGLRQFTAAMESCRQALQISPDFAEAHAALGASLRSVGRKTEAVASFRRAVELNPVFVPALCNLGAVLFDLGKYEESAAICRRALAIDPGYADAHCNLGMALHGLCEFEAATVSFRQALGMKSTFPEASNALGNSLQALGRLSEALPYFQSAVRSNPRYAEAHSNLGNLLKELGQLEAAIDAYCAAIAINPDFAEAQNNLGAALQAVGRLDQAADACRKALTIRPAFAEAHANLGNVLRDLGQLEDAAAHCRKALAIKPDFAEVHSNLGTVYRSMGNLRDARACYAKADALGFEGARVLDALLLPAIMGTCEEVLESRAEFVRRLECLTVDARPLKDPLRNVGEANFYLAYHALNDRDVQIKVAKYYAKACPSLLYVAPHCRSPGVTGQGRVRIGFFSKYLYEHSVSLCYSQIIESLAASNEFEVILVSDKPVDQRAYPRFTGKRLLVPYNLEGARATIAGLALDVLVYLDIGMEPLSYFLAFARLARVQCVLSGHPVTTGVPNVDYFVSNALMEPKAAEAHYSEKLAMLPRPLYSFARPVLPERFKTRADLGLPESRRLYMCPMRLQKMHPDFDEAITRILQIDAEGTVVMFDDVELAFGKRLLLERFERTMPSSVQGRVIFLPWMKDGADFMSAVAAADVILDPFHFGIGSTAISTFAVSRPLVTRAGEFMRGRVGMYFCNLLNVPECIATDSASYAKIAVALATDAAMRERVTAQIRENAHRIFENLQSANDLAVFLRSLPMKYGVPA